MKRSLFFPTSILILLLSCFVRAQNLVPNPGFELYYNLPDDVNRWCEAKYWDNLNGDCDLDSPFHGSPDYFHDLAESAVVNLPNTLVSSLNAYAGQAIMGFSAWSGGSSSPNYREYVSVRLTLPLDTGQQYLVSFFFSNGSTNIRFGGYGVNSLGVFFSKTPPVQAAGEPVPVSPQFEANELLYSNDWQEVSFSFIADDAFEYMSIGNFRDSTNTLVQQFEDYEIKPIAYYYIDEVCVVKEGDDCSIATEVTNLSSEQGAIQLFPNPVSGDLLSMFAYGGLPENSTLCIHNAIGCLVYYGSMECFSDLCEVPVNYLTPGIYFLTIQNDSVKWTRKFVKQ
jgi:hypothetical protein